MAARDQNGAAIEEARASLDGATREAQEAAAEEAHRFAVTQDAAAALEARASSGGAAGVSGAASVVQEEERQEAALRARLAQIQARQSESFKALARSKTELQARRKEPSAGPLTSSPAVPVSEPLHLCLGVAVEECERQRDVPAD